VMEMKETGGLFSEELVKKKITLRSDKSNISNGFFQQMERFIF